MREVVRDGVSGYVCRTVKDMVSRLRDLDIPPATVRKYVEENFSTEIMAEKYLALYREALGEHSDAREGPERLPAAGD